MRLYLTLLSVCLLAFSVETTAQGPGGEVIKRPPPPVDEQAVARAVLAARQRRQAAVNDQFELALKLANEAAEKYWNNYMQNPAASQQGFYDAETAYNRAAKLKPNDWRPYVGLGNLCTPYHNDEAQVAYQKATELKPNDVALLNSSANAYEATGKYKEAIPQLERSLRLDPSIKNYRAYEDLASSYQHVKLFDKSIDVLNRLLAIRKPDDKWFVHYQMAEVYGEAGRLDNAFAEYKEVFATAINEETVHSFKELLESGALNDSKKADGYYAIGRGFARKEAFEPAIPEYQRSIQLNSNVADYHLALGEAYNKTKKFSDAIPEFEQAIKLNSQDAAAYRGIGESYAETNEFDKALPAFKRASELNGNDFEIQASLGAVYYRLKDYQQSVEPLQKAITLRPKEDPFGQAVGLYYFLGLAHLKLGHKDEAMRLYQELKATGLLGADSAAQELLKEINK
jgi:tetratricopeptide (TPR) repeat protein